MWVGPSNLLLTFKCELDLQICFWRSNVSWTFKFVFDVQMWVGPSNLLLTLKCELDLQIMKKDPKQYYQMAFEHTNFILTYKMGKGTFGTIHSSYYKDQYLRMYKHLHIHLLQRWELWSRKCSPYHTYWDQHQTSAALPLSQCGPCLKPRTVEFCHSASHNNIWGCSWQHKHRECQEYIERESINLCM